MKVALAPSRIRLPSALLVQSRPERRSVALPESCLKAASWSSARTLIPHCLALLNTGQVDEARAILTDTNGGSSDTEVKELASMPTGVPSTSAARSTTPVGKADIARRIAWGTGSIWLIGRVSVGVCCVQL